MATRKAFIKKDQDIVLPYTRGELVLDSNGQEAFHSYDFVASRTKPGLITPDEKDVVSKAIITDEEIPESHIVQAHRIDKNGNIVNVYPITRAEAVKINIDGSETILTEVISQVLDLDDYPTQGSKKAVTSGGVWQHIDDTVGVIHRTVIKI